MDQAISQRALRSILAGLINSGLTTHELRRFAQDLDDPFAIKDLQSMIYRIAETLRQSDSDRRSPRSEGAEDLLLEFIRRKRMSKANVKDRMMSLVPGLPINDEQDSRTTRQLVQLFLQTGTNRANQFIKSFGDEVRDDPYLKGIIARDER